MYPKNMENGKSYVRRKIVVIKTLAISKIVFLALLTKIPHQVVKESEKIQKIFLWEILLGK